MANFTANMDTPKDGKKRKRCSFTAAEKKCLAGEVQTHPCIWDLGHPKHFNINYTTNAWCDISAVLEKSVEECKENWASLRDGKRYRTKAVTKRKSGDAGGTPIPEDSFNDDWEFAEAMQFLPDNAKKRKTLDSSSSNSVDDVFSEGTKSHYNYKETRSSTPLPDVNVQNLNELIQSQLQRNNEKALRKSEKGKVLPLKHQTLYAHMDTMLSRLPQESVDRISFQMLNIINEELLKN